MNSGNLVGAVFGAVLKVAATILVIFLVYKGAAACYDYGYRIFTEPAVSSGEGRVVTVTVTENMSASEVARLFAEKGLIKDARLFTLQYYLSEFRKDVRPGVYDLSTAMTAEEMMEVMATHTAEDEV